MATKLIKLIKPAPQNTTLRKLNEVSSVLEEQGIVQWKATVKNGSTTFVGKTEDGTTVRYTNYTTNGFSEKTISKCEQLQISNRQAEAKRLSRLKHTQAEIAERLGVSQKTISNDLRKK